MRYNISKLKESVQNLVVTPLILKYLKELSLPIKTKEGMCYIKRLKKFVQNTNGRNTIFCQRFSETITAMMKDVFSRAPYTLYCCSPLTPTKYFLKHSLLQPLRQWELNGFTEWFIYTEFLLKYKKLLNKSIPEPISKKVLYQLSPEERAVMIILSFLKDPTSVYFGTTHLLMRKTATIQLDTQLKDGA